MLLSFGISHSLTSSSNGSISSSKYAELAFLGERGITATFLLALLVRALYGLCRNYHLELNIFR